MGRGENGEEEEVMGSNGIGYSFPKKSRCPEHHDIGYQGCTWIQESCVGRMSFDVLQKYGIEKACMFVLLCCFLF